MLRIKSVEENELNSVAQICRKSLLGTKIMCQINSYGLERDFLSVWCCINSNNKICSVICKFEDSITLVADNYTEINDIRTFLDMIGFASLCCTYETALKMNYDTVTTKNAYVYGGSYDGEIFAELTEEYYKECYSLISKNIPDSFTDSVEAYMYFLSDFTYRKRRGYARMKGYAENGKLYSCALTSAETEKEAIISGVACDRSYRMKGLGKKTVLSLAEELTKEEKTVFVIALNKSAEGFYEHIGFRFKEKISFIERK